MGNLIMVYDTETTGIWNFKGSWNDDAQPNLVQLGYKVYDRNKEVIFEIGHLVDTTRDPSWSGIEPGAQAIHGITEEMVKLYGTTPHKTMASFNYWAEKCSLFVAHNDPFDTKVMMRFAARAEWNPQVFHGAEKYCTMMTSTDICKIPGPRGNKWPKLNEAYPFFMNGEQFKGAHNALADVNACGDIFWQHVERGHYVLNG